MQLIECRAVDPGGTVHNAIKNDENHAFHSMCFMLFRLDPMLTDSALDLWQEVALEETATCLTCIARGDDLVRTIIKGRFDIEP